MPACLLFWERHRAPEHRSAEWIARQRRKVDGGLRALAELAGDRDWMVGDRFGLAEIATGTVLRYLDVRFPEHPWRQQYPNLVALSARLEARPSFADDRAGAADHQRQGGIDAAHDPDDPTPAGEFPRQPARLVVPLDLHRPLPDYPFRRVHRQRPAAGGPRRWPLAGAGADRITPRATSWRDGLPTEVDWHDPEFMREVTERGWLIWPAIP